MTTISSPTFSFNQSRLVQFLRDCFTGSRSLSLNALALLACFVIMLLLQLVDDRTLIGANVWHKPAKFFFSLTVQLATVAWALSLVPPQVRTLRSVRWASAMLIGATWFEQAYLVFRAARGEASHFNNGDLLAQVGYALMGLGALALTLTSAWIGFVIWRHRNGDLWRESAGLGLVLGSVLALLAAGYMSQGTGHWVGGELSDANGLPVFLWSTTGGDLRIAHFVGLHAAQAVPFAATSGHRGAVYAMALVFILATAATFVQAVSGVPLFRV